MSATPCDMHDLSNCATCSGADKRLEQSLSAPKYDAGELPPLPYIPGGVTIHSQYPGTCSGCGQRWEPGEPIFRARGSNDVGWVCVERCA